MKKNLYFSLILLLTCILTLAACGEEQDSGEEQADEEDSGENTKEDSDTSENNKGNKGTIQFGYNNYSENVAVSNMWKILLEEEGYEVELVSLEKAALYAGVSSGELDIGMAAWVPHTDQHHVDEYEDGLQVQEPWYENTQLGLTVPEYMTDVNSIEDLNEYKDEFDGTIYGIEPGAGITGLTEETIENYELDYELQPSSEQAMMTELDQAYKNEKPIVTTLWSPHWAFAEYDLKYLEDPDTTYGKSDNIVYITHESFEEDHEEVVTWMNEWSFDDDSLGELTGTINEMDDPAAGAEAWIEENRDLINQWME